MAGTREGGLKAAATNKKKYGEDFYKIQGAKGGKKNNNPMFALNLDLARRAGAKGGRISRRRPTARGLKARAEADRIRSRIESGEPVKNIAKSYELSVTSIRLIARRANI